jgi:hypothetical protein
LLSFVVLVSSQVTVLTETGVTQLVVESGAIPIAIFVPADWAQLAVSDAAPKPVYATVAFGMAPTQNDSVSWTLNETVCVAWTDWATTPLSVTVVYVVSPLPKKPMRAKNVPVVVGFWIPLTTNVTVAGRVSVWLEPHWKRTWRDVPDDARAELGVPESLEVRVPPLAGDVVPIAATDTLIPVGAVHAPKSGVVQKLTSTPRRPVVPPVGTTTLKLYDVVAVEPAFVLFDRLSERVVNATASAVLFINNGATTPTITTKATTALSALV